MIDRDPEFDTFAESCAWPDHPRRRATEHYVNLPRDADGLEEDPCPLATECVVSAIEQDLAVLSSPSATEQERLEALKYLGHWVGDVHQPLHVSFEDDRGGNSIGVSGGLCSWNLHAVWDGCIIEQGLPGDPYTLARQLLDEVTDEERAAWQGSSPIDWANESFAISISPEVQYCVGTDTGCWYGGARRFGAADVTCMALPFRWIAGVQLHSLCRTCAVRRAACKPNPADLLASPRGLEPLFSP